MAWKYGTAGADKFLGSKTASGIDAPDWYDCLGGNDTILAGGGWTDEIRGGSGNDYIDLQTGNGKAWGGTGNDTLKATGGDSLSLFGEAGDDLIDGNGAYWRTLDGGDGADRILSGFTGSSTFFMNGGAGNDVLVSQDVGTVGYADSSANGGAGIDTFHLDNHSVIGGAFHVATFVMSSAGDAGEWFLTRDMTEPLDTIDHNGYFRGFEKIYNGQTSTAAINYKGGFADMTVTGGMQNDRFESGAGDEVFAGSGGRDAFVFDFSKGNLGVDDINGFVKGVDSIVAINSTGYSFKQVEANGHTIVTALNGGGEQVLSLDIDATGFPAFNSMDYWLV